MTIKNSDWEKNEDKKFDKGKTVPQIVIKYKWQRDWEYDLAKLINKLFRRNK